MLCISWRFRGSLREAPFNGAMRHDERHFTACEPGLSAPHAAHALGVSLSTIYRWADLGYLLFHRTASGQRRFTASRSIASSASSKVSASRRSPLRDRRTG
jgi:excisionase family DNA binding protein